jgi:hypothetical protein
MQEKHTHATQTTVSYEAVLRCSSDHVLASLSWTLYRPIAGQPTSAPNMLHSLQNRAARRFAARNAERLRSRVLGVPAKTQSGVPHASVREQVRET